MNSLHPPPHSLPRRQFVLSSLSLLAASRASASQPPAARARPAEPPDVPGDQFLHDQAQRIVDSARLRAGESSGPHHNSTPFDLHIPGGNMGYPAFWVRDAVMMLGGSFITAAEVEGWIRLIASTIRTEAWNVRPGVIVPAYCIPDHINFDGKPTFYPGSYETTDRQGGHPWGKYPPLDDNFYFILAVHEHHRLTGDIIRFKSSLTTTAGEQPLADLCEKIYRQPPAESTTGLVLAGDIDTENAKDWGFCDSVFKSGSLLFPSLLKARAARLLAELFTAAGVGDKAELYRREAARISAAIAPTFLRAPPDATEAWLHSATGIGNQPDVWGSALAVHWNIIEPSEALRISRALVSAHREQTAFANGQARHLPSTDPVSGGAWERSVSPPGEYQNGGYWSAPIGWCIGAMHRTDPSAARQLAHEYLQFLRAAPRADGLAQAWEWSNPHTGNAANTLYVASVALPYLALREAGLLSLL